MGTKVVVVGAGPGGLTAAMKLARQGFEVEVFEKEAQVGGRNGRIELDGGFSFDIGPTFLMLPSTLREAFQDAGRDYDKYVEMRRIDPLYRLRFGGKTDFLPPADPEKMAAEIERVFPGESKNYARYMEKEGAKFRAIYDMLTVPYDSPLDFLKPRFLKGLPKLDARATVYERLASYFGHPDLRISMAFQSKYLGMSPWECPATFTMIAYIEHAFGIWHTMGGLNAIPRAMAKVTEEHGGKIHLSTPVKQVIVENGAARGVLLENGERIAADYVVLNADFAHAMTKLVAPEHRRKWTDAELARRPYSCSTFMLYLGVDKQYDIPHHNVFFADDYKANVSEIVETKALSQKPSFYIQNASVIDPSLAPAGKSAIYVLVPIANQTSKIDWEKEKAGYRNLVLDAVKQRTELTDLDQHIVAEKIVTPADWESRYAVYNGATFNLAHNIGQMLYFRPHNRFEEFRNCYLVGGGTHPGSGLPTIVQSGRISADQILADATRRGLKLAPPAPAEAATELRKSA